MVVTSLVRLDSFASLKIISYIFFLIILTLERYA